MLMEVLYAALMLFWLAQKNTWVFASSIVVLVIPEPLHIHVPPQDIESRSSGRSIDESSGSLVEELVIALGFALALRRWGADVKGARNTGLETVCRGAPPSLGRTCTCKTRRLR